MSDPILFWVLASAAAFCVGSGKGGMPMIAMLSVPILSTVIPPMQGAALLLPVYLISDVYSVWIYRKSYSKRNLLILMPAAAIGVFIGWLLASDTDENMVRVLIGCVGLTFLVMRQWGRMQGKSTARPADVPRGVFWGSLAGFTSFVSHAGGPAFQLYVLPQKLPKMMFAGTATILFAVINWMKVPPYLALGLIDWGDWRIVLTLSPVAIFGAWCGYHLTRLIPQKIFFGIVEFALLLISINLIRVGLSA